MTEKKKIALIFVAAIIAIIYFKRGGGGNVVMTGTDWASFADVAGARINEGFKILGIDIPNAAAENKRLLREQAYSQLRDVKDNSKLYSNDILIM